MDTSNVFRQLVTPQGAVVCLFSGLVALLVVSGIVQFAARAKTGGGRAFLPGIALAAFAWSLSNRRADIGLLIGIVALTLLLIGRRREG